MYMYTGDSVISISQECGMHNINKYFKTPVHTVHIHSVHIFLVFTLYDVHVHVHPTQIHVHVCVKLYNVHVHLHLFL